MNISSNFRTAVINCLNDKKMTQLDLSIITEISQPSICRYLAGKRFPTLSQVEKIAEALELHPITLLAYPNQIAIVEKVL